MQKEIRAIRAQEMEKKRREDEEKERYDSRFNRSGSTAQSLQHISPSGINTTPKQRGYSINESDQDNPKELKVNFQFSAYLVI